MAIIENDPDPINMLAKLHMTQQLPQRKINLIRNCRFLQLPGDTPQLRQVESLADGLYAEALAVLKEYAGQSVN